MMSALGSQKNSAPLKAIREETIDPREVGAPPYELTLQEVRRGDGRSW